MEKQLYITSYFSDQCIFDEEDAVIEVSDLQNYINKRTKNTYDELYLTISYQPEQDISVICYGSDDIDVELYRLELLNHVAQVLTTKDIEWRLSDDRFYYFHTATNTHKVVHIVEDSNYNPTGEFIVVEKGNPKKSVRCKQDDLINVL